MSETATTARYELLDSKDHAPTDEEEGEEEDDSKETSLTAVSWILGIHFFASALTVTALPSLLIEILNGIVTNMYILEATLSLPFIDHFKARHLFSHHPPYFLPLYYSTYYSFFE